MYTTSEMSLNDINIKKVGYFLKIRNISRKIDYLLFKVFIFISSYV